MPERPLARQFPTALAFALRNQARNRFAWLLLALFVPAWYALMGSLIPHDPLAFRLFSTGARQKRFRSKLRPRVSSRMKS